MAYTDVPELLGALRDIGFPAGKEQLVTAARATGASDEVVKALSGIPPVQYSSREEVARSVRVDPDSDLGHDAAQRAEQVRPGGKPGLSQHVRDVAQPPVLEELER